MKIRFLLSAPYDPVRPGRIHLTPASCEHSLKGTYNDPVQEPVNVSVNLKPHALFMN